MKIEFNVDDNLYQIALEYMDLKMKHPVRQNWIDSKEGWAEFDCFNELCMNLLLRHNIIKQNKNKKHRVGPKYVPINMDKFNEFKMIINLLRCKNQDEWAQL